MTSKLMKYVSQISTVVKASLEVTGWPKLPELAENDSLLHLAGGSPATAAMGRISRTASTWPLLAPNDARILEGTPSATEALKEVEIRDMEHADLSNFYINPAVWDQAFLEMHPVRVYLWQTPSLGYLLYSSGDHI